MTGLPSMEKTVNMGKKAAFAGAGLLVARNVVEPMVPNILPFDGADIIVDLVLAAVAAEMIHEDVGVGIALSAVLKVAQQAGMQM